VIHDSPEFVYPFELLQNNYRQFIGEPTHMLNLEIIEEDAKRNNLPIEQQVGIEMRKIIRASWFVVYYENELNIPYYIFFNTMKLLFGFKVNLQSWLMPLILIKISKFEYYHL